MTIQEVIKVAMAMDEDTYYALLEALEEMTEDGEYVYSTQEVAQMFGVALEVVEYIDRAEHCDF